MKILPSDILSELYNFATDKRKESNEWFFKTGKGEYGEDDIFMGVCVPDIRKVAGKFKNISEDILQELLESELHEVRLCALIIAVLKFKKFQKKGDFLECKKLYNWYLENTKFINNWDLVDTSCRDIVGNYLLKNQSEIKILHKLAKSKNLWERRIAIVSTWAFIRLGEIDLTLDLAKKLLSDKEDLMHKAVGWMLRESWKRDAIKVENFLEKNYKNLPRTTLRYAIERIEKDKRKKILKGQFN